MNQWIEDVMQLFPNIMLASDLADTSNTDTAFRLSSLGKSIPGALLYLAPNLRLSTTDVLTKAGIDRLRRSLSYSSGHLDATSWDLLEGDRKDASLYGLTAPSVFAREHIQIDDLDDSELWRNGTSVASIPRNNQSFTEAFSRITFLAERIDIVDPYLVLKANRTDYSWMFNALRKRTPSRRLRLTFHIMTRDDRHIEDLKETQLELSRWYSTLVYRDKVDLRVVKWANLHDRMIITERHVVGVHAGLGLSNVNPGRASTEWSVLNHKQADVRRNQFDPAFAPRPDDWPILIDSPTPVTTV